MERCDNCERAIGNLEPASVWRERVVCGDCHQRLLSGGVQPPDQRQVQVIEQTSKVFKLQIVIGTVLFAAGVLIAALSLARPGQAAFRSNELEMLWGLTLSAAAALWLTVVKLLIWWNHA